MGETNRQVLLASRPAGAPEEANFRLVETAVPEPGPGQVLVRNHWLSLDPYMRGRMSAAKSYAAPVEIGAVMIGGTAGEVVASRSADFRVGDRVVGALGWQLYGLSDGSGLRKLANDSLPLSLHLGVLGMPGVTAWLGLHDICAPKSGDTVLVSAAAGAVGSVVGQLARREGCRVVGIAGGPAKCRHVVEELGFDACVDYKAGRLAGDLAAATPAGVDALFENVGGECFDAALERLNPFARVALCGLVSQYNATEPQPLRNVRALLVNRVRLQGFIVTDHLGRWDAVLQRLTLLVQSGELKYRETVAQGLEGAPRAFIGLLRGENVGKQLVRLT